MDTLLYPGAYPVRVAKVQFRVSDEAVEYLAKAGLNPNEVAREAFEREVRTRRAATRLGRLRALGITFDGRDAAALIREDRDR